jgi:hypothetical protein
VSNLDHLIDSSDTHRFATSPSCSEEDKSFDKDETDRRVRFADFCGWEELEVGRKFVEDLREGGINLVLG